MGFWTQFDGCDQTTALRKPRKGKIILVVGRRRLRNGDLLAEDRDHETGYDAAAGAGRRPDPNLGRWILFHERTSIACSETPDRRSPGDSRDAARDLIGPDTVCIIDRHVEIADAGGILLRARDEADLRAGAVHRRHLIAALIEAERIPAGRGGRRDRPSGAFLAIKHAIGEGRGSETIPCAPTGAARQFPIAGARRRGDVSLKTHFAIDEGCFARIKPHARTSIRDALVIGSALRHRRGCSDQGRRGRQK